MIRLNAYKLVLRAVSFPRVLAMLLFHRPALIPKLPQAAALLPGPSAIPSRPRCRWSPTLRWPGALQNLLVTRVGGFDIESAASRSHRHDVRELPVHPHRRLATEFLRNPGFR